VNAQSTATEAKATAPEALLTHVGKGRKIPGKTGRAAALVPASHKGATSFAHLMGANEGAEKEAKSLAASLMAAAAGLKSLGRTALVAQGEKASGLKLHSALGKMLDESEKQSLGKDEKADGKKKTSRLMALHVGVATDAVADKSKPAEGAPAAEKRGDASAAQAPGGARAAATPRPEPGIHVVDLRKRTADKASEGASSPQKAAQTVLAAKEPGTLFIQQAGAPKDGGVEVPRKVVAAPTVTPQSGLERFREMAGSELVRAANLVLRDGGGEIRLVLKPESLGSVRIRMNLVDNKIEGRIIVDTSAVKQVIDQNIDTLGRALTAGGFQTASLQVSVGGQNANNGRQMQEPPTGVRRAVAQGFERNVPGVESLSMGDLLVNLFV
jgi:hypothetical protein